MSGVDKGRRSALYALAVPGTAVLVTSLLLLTVNLLDTISNPFTDVPTHLVLDEPNLDVEKVETVFSAAEYNIENIYKKSMAVPRLYVARIPDGLAKLKSIPRRKHIFLRIVLPMVLRVNESANIARRRLLGLQVQIAAGKYINPTDAGWVEAMSTTYKLDNASETSSEHINALLLRVAPVPVSLALAQAAEESGWGTSRFAQEGNALFGQWEWSESLGIIPIERGDKESHSVRSFHTLMDSVEAYVQNLNTHWAYADFRQRREKILRDNKIPDGLHMAETLHRYSERDLAYVKSLQQIISYNNLRFLDRARLASSREMMELKIII